MSTEISIEEMINKVGNKFLLTTAVAHRAIQLKEGDDPLIEGANTEQPVLAALKEFQNDKIVMGISNKDDISRSEAIFQEEDEEVVEEETEEKPTTTKKKAGKK